MDTNARSGAHWGCRSSGPDAAARNRGSRGAGSSCESDPEDFGFRIAWSLPQASASARGPGNSNRHNPTPTMPDTPDNPSAPPETGAEKPARLMSLDALRGFDMFWIVGADALVEGLRKVSDAGPIHTLATQLEHAQWAGFHFEDLIFPMFVFIVGVSLVFSLGRTIDQEGRAGAMARIVRRALLMYL